MLDGLVKSQLGAKYSPRIQLVSATGGLIPENS